MRREISIEEWMLRREADLRRQALIDGRSADDMGPDQTISRGPNASEEEIEFQGRAAADEIAPEAMDLGLRFEKARKGSTISGLVGSSDPRAVGKFLSLNGMSGRDSTVRPGRSYVVPTNWDDATDQEERVGQLLLREDNARLRSLADRELAATRQADLFASGRNIFTGEPAQVASDVGQRFSSQPSRQRTEDGPTARALAGAFGWASGVGPGVVRGAINTVEGAVDGAHLLYRLTDPYDRIRSLPGQSAADQVLGAASSAGDYVARSFENPSIIRDDIEGAFGNFQRKQNPLATPMASTAFGEFQRMREIGKNNGELGADIGSMFVGGAFTRSAAGLGATSKAATVAEKAYLAANPTLAARFAELYDGMSHHIIGRRTRFPDWMGGGKLPKWLIESEFNKIRHEGITIRDLYRNHIGVDDKYHGGKSGGVPWSARRHLGWDRYGAWDRFNYGTSPYTKALIGPALLGGTLVDEFPGAAQ